MHLLQLGLTHIWRPWKLSNFKDPSPILFIYVQNSSTPLILDVQFQINPSSPNDDQSTKRKYNPRMTIICYQVLPSGFDFNINPLILSGFPKTSSHFSEASLLYLLLCGFTLLCEKLSQYIKKCLLFIISPSFSTLFTISLFCFHNLKT